MSQNTQEMSLETDGVESTSHRAKNVTSHNLQFPNTLEGFGFTFKDGKLIDLKTGEGFVFTVRSDQDYNQRRYDALGEVVNEYVYNLLETEGKLKKVFIPTDAGVGEARGFIFMSDDALTNPYKLLVIIHGTGVVRAGQWSRRLIINDCLDSGTQLPYIARARSHGYAVIVLNTNQNQATNENGYRTPIRGSSTPTEHGLYVWDHFIAKSAAKFVAIVAHSYGGVVTLEMAAKREDAFLSRVTSVAFTDSVHRIHPSPKSKNISKFLQNNSVNWVSSNKPLGTPLESPNRDCPRKSAGTPKHELTSWMSIDEIFRFLQDAQRRAKQEL